MAAAGILTAIAVAPKQPAVHENEPRWSNTAYYVASFEVLPNPRFKCVNPSLDTREQPTFTAPRSTILYKHDGGTFQFDVHEPRHRTPAFVLVRCQVAPGKPHPTLSEVCYAGLKWLYEHANQFAMDMSRIATTDEHLAAVWALTGKRSRPAAAPVKAGSSLSGVG
ncbi:hypothetical protein ABOM_010278 [Aspergillus bombycis]|uniref:Uncharacterized protein n=1 Tax=Aspergillus bombycis TaxID=109264 RepID=A0A1F7ZPM0_9EURO|nr:hypothetical protein ABOM_010278 [Aspergillus bombycis]OGM41406.1 hypothetical protein ABOM_010278 [Aspergillus bombycis]